MIVRHTASRSTPSAFTSSSNCFFSTSSASRRTNSVDTRSISSCSFTSIARLISPTIRRAAGVLQRSNCPLACSRSVGVSPHRCTMCRRSSRSRSRLSHQCSCTRHDKLVRRSAAAPTAAATSRLSRSVSSRSTGCPYERVNIHHLRKQPIAVEVPLHPGKARIQLRVPRPQPRHRGHPPRPDVQLPLQVRDQAVSARDRTSACPAPARASAIPPPARPAAWCAPTPHDQRGVGRRAAHVHHQRVGLLREVSRPGHAGRRPRQNRLDRPLPRRLHAHQRSIAPHHHHRRCHAALPQAPVRLLQEADQDRDDPAVQRRRLARTV